MVFSRGLFASQSGLQAQSKQLQNNAHNIANSQTNGYQRYETLFTSLVDAGVEAHSRRDTTAGAIYPTSHPGDIAIAGNQYLLVTDQSGTQYLSKTGSFTPDAYGFLTDHNGNRLMGYPIAGDQKTAAPLMPIQISQQYAGNQPTENVTLRANLPSDFAGSVPISALVNGAPTRTTLSAPFQIRSSFYDAHGTSHNMSFDIFKVSGNQPNLWAVRIQGSQVDGLKASADAQFAGVTGGSDADIQLDNIVYLQFDGQGALRNSYIEGSFGPASEQITVDPTGANITLSPLQARNPAFGATAAPLSVVIGQNGIDYVTNIVGNPVDPAAPFSYAGNDTLIHAIDGQSPFSANGASAQIFDLNIGTATNIIGNNQTTYAGHQGSGLDGLTNLASATGNQSLNVSQISQDGSGPSDLREIDISDQGIVYGIYASGVRRPLYQLATAQVPNQAGLTELSGNIYQTSAHSGTAQISSPNSANLFQNGLMSSNVSLDTELSQMMMAKTAFQANAKAFALQADMHKQVIDIKS